MLLQSANDLSPTFQTLITTLGTLIITGVVALLRGQKASEKSVVTVEKKIDVMDAKLTTNGVEVAALREARHTESNMLHGALGSVEVIKQQNLQIIAALSSARDRHREGDDR